MQMPEHLEEILQEKELALKMSSKKETELIWR